jgi:DNA end-binding protein Ku
MIGPSPGWPFVGGGVQTAGANRRLRVQGSSVALRSIWNGTIAFAGVFVPVKVHSAIEDRSVHFHEVHRDDGARIEHKRFCSKEDKEVAYKEIIKGYEVSEGTFVVLDDDELKAAAGEASRLIEVEQFVCAGDIDPVMFDRTYYLGSQDKGKDAYRLLHDALAKTERAGIGRWVFHNREYLVAVRALDDVLGLHTMRFADELVPVKELEIATPSRNPSKRELDMAGQLVESLHAPFEPTAYEDTYRERLLEYIKAKAKGKLDALPRRTDAQHPDDLLAALEASIARKG